MVFADEVTREDRKGKQNRIDWLNRQPYAVQYQVLGSRKKVDALQSGLLKEHHIERPWKDIRQHYEDGLL